MAKQILSLPLSGRQNIIKWLEKFRNSGEGLKQSTLDIFDIGNDYTTNAKINGFNKNVDIIKKALEKKGIEIKLTPKGRYSITSNMLNKLKLEDFTEELRNFVFDKSMAGIKFDDEKIVPLLDKMYKNNELQEFDSLNIFKAFASFANIPALNWLIKTYTLKNYSINFRGKIMIDIISELKEHEDKLVDFYISSKIIKEGYELMESITIFKSLLDLSHNSLKKILPLIRIEPDDMFCFSYLERFVAKNPALLDLFKFNKKEWEILAASCVSYISNEMIFKVNIKFIKTLIEKSSNEFLTCLITKTDWTFHDNVLALVPDIEKIFIF